VKIEADGTTFLLLSQRIYEDSPDLQPLDCQNKAQELAELQELADRQVAEMDAKMLGEVDRLESLARKAIDGGA
jgi:hypothetical protein